MTHAFYILIFRKLKFWKTYFLTRTLSSSHLGIANEIYETKIKALKTSKKISWLKNISFLCPCLEERNFWKQKTKVFIQTAHVFLQLRPGAKKFRRVQVSHKQRTQLVIKTGASWYARSCPSRFVGVTELEEKLRDYPYLLQDSSQVKTKTLLSLENAGDEQMKKKYWQAQWIFTERWWWDCVNSLYDIMMCGRGKAHANFVQRVEPSLRQEGNKNGEKRRK